MAIFPSPQSYLASDYVGAPVDPPAPTSESTTTGTNFAVKTFDSFTDPDGRIHSYSLTIVNARGTASWSGSGLGPYTPTSSDGDAGSLVLDALDSQSAVIASAVHTYDRASATSGGSWGTLYDLDMTTVTNAGPFTSGTQTFTVTGDTLEVVAQRISSNTGLVQGINGTGLLIDSVNNANSFNACLNLSQLFPSYGISSITPGPVAFHVVLGSLNFTEDVGDGWMAGLNSTTSHNSGNMRGFRGYSVTGSTMSMVLRYGGTDTGVVTTVSIPSSMVITLILWYGQIVQVQYTSGNAPPTPGTGTVYMAGGSAIAANSSSLDYGTSPIYCILNMTAGSSVVLKRVLVQRWG